MRTLIASIIIIQFFSCSQPADKKVEASIKAESKMPSDNSQNEKSTSKNEQEVISETDALIEKVNANLTNYKMEKGLNDKVEIYFEGELVRKIKFPLTDESDNIGAYGGFYFDNNGKLVCEKLEYNSQEMDLKAITSAFWKKHRVLRYQERLNGKIVPQKDPLESQPYFETCAVIEIDRYLANYVSGYKTPETSLDAGYTIRTSSDIELYDKPNGNVIGKLKEDLPLIYIQREYKFESNGDKKWFWAQVKTSQNQTGWIFAHPDNIEDLTDGD